MTGPQARVIAVTHFLGPPDGCTPAADQDQGSECARLVETAGRVCYQSFGKGRDSAAFHENILASGHGSVLEHASVSFYLSGISRGCAMEWNRHRHAAISQRSTRYVDESESEWCWHPALTQGIPVYQLLDGETKGSLVNDARHLYRTLVTYLEPLVGRKQARGAARGVLGNALSTAMVWTANIRALRGVLEQRATPQADGEIRLLADAVYEAALPVCPEYLSEYTRSEAPDGIGFCLETPHRKV